MTERRPATGRRAASRPRGRLARTLGPVELVALALPLLTVAVLALVRPLDDAPPDRSASDVSLRSATVVCPQGLSDAGTVALASSEGVVGEVATRVPADDVIEVDGTTRTGLRSALVMQAAGDLAAGLVASRYGDGAAIGCSAPAADQWFTGVGAGPEHSSVLELVNPDGGRAVADVTVLGRTGPVDVPALRGVTVTGGDTMRFDLAEVVPTRDELTLRVQVARGRLGVTVVDQVDDLGRGGRSRDWLPSQSAPATSAYLLGVGGRSGERTLVVANPGADEARVQLRLLTRESEFAPEQAEEIRVAPGTTEVVDLTDLMGDRTARGVTGLRLEATVPVTATLRTVAGGDLSHAVAGETVTDRAAITLPRAPARLLLGGAPGVGVVTYVVRDDDGAELTRERVELTPGTAERVKLPRGGSLLVLSVERSSVVAAVEAGPPGLAVLPLSELVLTGRVPDVRPALR